MNKLIIASAVMATLAFSVQSQAGIYDYSRSTIGQGELIHTATEQGMTKHHMADNSMNKKSHMKMSKDKQQMSKQTLWQWDAVNYK
jgi:hypothetical protein